MAPVNDQGSESAAEARTGAPKSIHAHELPESPRAKASLHSWRKWLLWMGAAVGLAIGGYLLKPTLETAMNTVSTDDAYVNSHVTFVAPRVSGQVSRILVD